MKLFTIGFTKTSAEGFFDRLSKAHVKKLVDIRLNNVSQLAGFAKRDDLRYFAKAICHIDYQHIPTLAPTRDILDEYKKSKGSWNIYAKKFLDLMGLNDKQSVRLLPVRSDLRKKLVRRHAS